MVRRRRPAAGHYAHAETVQLRLSSRPSGASHSAMHEVQSKQEQVGQTSIAQALYSEQGEVDEYGTSSMNNPFN